MPRFFLALFLLYGLAANAAVTLDDLWGAVKANDRSTVRQLLAKGMEPNSVDSSGQSLLMYSAREGQLDMMELLIQSGAKVNARNAHGETALMLAAYKGNLESVKLLHSRKAAINQDGWAALHYAAIQGWTEVTRYLIEQGGAKVDAPAPNGATALMLAARNGHASVARLLLEKGANPDLQTDSGATALKWAEEAGNTEIAQLLRNAIKK